MLAEVRTLLFIDTFPVCHATVTNWKMFEKKIEKGIYVHIWCAGPIPIYGILDALLVTILPLNHTTWCLIIAQSSITEMTRSSLGDTYSADVSTLTSQNLLGVRKMQLRHELFTNNLVIYIYIERLMNPNSKLLFLLFFCLNASHLPLFLISLLFDY